MTARARIKTALDGIPGVTGHKSEPDQKFEKAAWPVLRELNATGTLCDPYRRSYDVFLVLPNGYSGVAADAAEALIEALVEALDPLGELGDPLAEVVQIAFDNKSTVPGLRVRVTPDPEEG